ncbi:MAG: hypothetical protein JW727_02840 [Candidatus Aenigmarchaeota archaeon]|nr:hypothetical protein [Candidatus Aenigmarchaeota archaeon]
MEQRLILSFAILLSLALILPPALAFVGPVSYLTETVYADYYANGTASSDTFAQCNDNVNPCKFGFVEVALPNANDTLQTVRVTLSGTTGTNLAQARGYQGTVTSYPTIWGKTKIYVNDTVFGADQNYYKITDGDLAPAIVLNVTSYTNDRGGYDFYDYDNIGPGGSNNTMNFTITAYNPSTSTGLDAVTILILFDTDTNGGADSLNITSATPGTVQDSDSDGYNDRINWTGTIAASGTQQFNISATLIETVNIANGVTNLTLDYNNSQKGLKAIYNKTSALTGITITAATARGSIRQGIDMAERSGGGIWDARGFIHVLSSNSSQVGAGTMLTYNISDWQIYNVSVTTGNMDNLLQSGTYTPANFTANYGRLYTDSATFSSNNSRVQIDGNKPYLASSFNWSVYWNDTYKYYVSYINTTLDLPTLYKVDQIPSLSLGGYLLVGSATTVNVTYISEYQGDMEATIKNMTILSVVPRNTTLGAQRTPLNITNTTIVVSWWNTTSLAWETIKTGNGTSDGVTVTITQPSGGSNGLVQVTIANFSQTKINKYLAQGEKIQLFYGVDDSTDLETGDSFQFSANSTITSLSGTPETEAPSPQTIASSGRQLVGYKDLFVANPATPTLVNGTLVVQVFGGDISNIKFIDYVPNGTNFSCSTNAILFYNSTDGSTWATSTDISVNDTGYLTLADGTVVRSCEYTSANGLGWTLGSSKAVRVMYQVNITSPGLYEVPMGIAGFDPATGQGISTTVYGVVRISVPEPEVPPIITEGGFLVAKSVQVGNPVVWVKSFEVFSPNSKFVDAEFSTEVFEDTTAGYVSYIDEMGQEKKEEVAFVTKDGKRQMVWSTKLYPQETRNYDLRILTPPVLETDRDIEVLGVIEEKMVELRMSVFMRSMAQEEYTDVQLNLPISASSVLSITDGEGNPISYTGDSTIKAIIPSFGPQAIKELVIRYKQSYPKIIVTPNRDRYDPNSIVSLDILVIHGGEEVNYPYLETEVYTPDRDTVYANIQQLDKLEPITKTSLSESFTVPLNAPAGRYIAESRLRSDMATLATGTGNFYVGGGGSAVGSWMGYIMLLLALGILYFGVKRIRSETRRVSESSIPASQNA